MRGQAGAAAFEVGVDVVDLHAHEFRAVPIPRLLRMGVKQQPAVLGDLPGERCRIGLVAQHDAGGDAERHDPVLHLEARDEELAVVHTPPLQAKVSPALDGMIAEADEVQPGGLERAQDLLEGHLAVVGELGMAVQDAPILVPAGLIRAQAGAGREGLCHAASSRGKRTKWLYSAPRSQNRQKHRHQDHAQSNEPGGPAQPSPLLTLCVFVVHLSAIVQPPECRLARLCHALFAPQAI